MVDIRSVKAAAYFFLFFSLLVSQRLASCASINEQGGWVGAKIFFFFLMGQY